MLDYPGVWQASYLDNFLEHPVGLSATYYHKTKISVNWHRFKKAYSLLSHYPFPSLCGTWPQTESWISEYQHYISEYKRDTLIESTNISVHNKYSRLSLQFVILDRHHYLFNEFTLCLPKWYILIIYTNIANSHGVLFVYSPTLPPQGDSNLANRKNMPKMFYMDKIYNAFEKPLESQQILYQQLKSSATSLNTKVYSIN